MLDPSQSAAFAGILRFCSKPAEYTGFDVEGTFGEKTIGGWLKQCPWETWKQMPRQFFVIL